MHLKPIPLRPTSCPPGPRMRERDSMVTSQTIESKSQSLLMNPSWPLPWTGVKEVPSPQLRTKVNADHAGPSHPLELLRVLISTLLMSFSHSQSNNLLTAPLKTTLAMVVWWTTPSCMPWLIQCSSREITHMLPRKRLADIMKERARSLFQLSMMLHILAPNLRLPSTSTLFPSPSKPISLLSNSTMMVSSHLVADNVSTTVSLLSDMEPWTVKSTSSSKTPGAQVGVMKDTSESHQLSAVSPCLHLTQLPTEWVIHI